MIIRPAIPDDAAAVSAVRTAWWRATYRGVVPDSFLDAMTPDESTERWRDVASGANPDAALLVCEVEGAVVGFACYGAARPPQLGYSGELYATYYRPEAMGKGYGTAVVREGIAGLKRMAHADMTLGVMEANARGRRFYYSIGGVVIPDSCQSFEID